MAKFKHLTEEQKKEIIELYKTGNYSCVKLAEMYRYNTSSINRMLVRNNIDFVENKFGFFNKRYSVNEDWLDVIDDEYKAYFLGFFFADGYNNEVKGIIKLALQEEDKEILDKFQSLFSSSYPLSLEERSKKNPKWKNICVITYNNKKLSQRLAEFGAIQRKSLVLKFPTEYISENLIPHFIRGYFDGDGSLSCVGKYKSVEASFTSSHNFCIIAKSIIEKYVGINCYLKQNKRHKIQTKIIKINGSKQALKFLDWLYQDASIFLTRKYNKYIEYKKLKWKLKS